MEKQLQNISSGANQSAAKRDIPTTTLLLAESSALLGERGIVV